MAHRRASADGREDSSRRLRQLLRKAGLVVLYAGALTALALWEYRDRFEDIGHECTLTDAPAPSVLYSEPYKRLLNWASSDAARHVTMVAIPADLDEIQSNACLGRGYMADLLRALGTMRPAEIVIDKFYSADACTTTPEYTQEMLAAAAALPFPVIVGESTGNAGEERDGACLVRKRQLNWGTANVRHGLTRLDSHSEKVPLQWRVLPVDGNGGVELADSLSLATVNAYDAGYKRQQSVRDLLRSERHPYANLHVELSSTTSTAVLCAAGDAKAIAQWKPDCSRPAEPLEINGKVVVIGAQQQNDFRRSLDFATWGYVLQAHYIESLLSGTFLRTVPFYVSFTLFALFIFVTEGVPTVLAYVNPRWKRKRFLRHAYVHRRYFWTAFWALTFIVFTSVAALLLRYLPPLIMFGDILLVAVTRLLIFAAESVEHPLTHTHRKAVH
jgi:hypothetical protein